MKWLKEYWEEFNLQKRWQKVLFSIILILAILFMFLLTAWYVSSGHYYRALYGDDYELDY